MQNDLQHRIATDAINALDNLNIDTTTTNEPMTRWDRVRDAVRNYSKADPAPLWEAIAKDDQKAVIKAATEYQVAQAIAVAAKADARREDTYRADALATVKALIIDAQDHARDVFNEAAETYTAAFRDANNRPDPSVLIVSDGGADIWRDLIESANTMTAAANVIKRAAEFGHKVIDEGSGLDQQVPFATGLPTITAVSETKAATDWLNTKEHAPHREWATYLLAGGSLYAGDLTEQRAEVERLIDQAQDGRKQKMIPDMVDSEQRALKRAMKTARKAGRA